MASDGRQMLPIPWSLARLSVHPSKTRASHAGRRKVPVKEEKVNVDELTQPQTPMKIAIAATKAAAAAATDAVKGEYRANTPAGRVVSELKCFPTI